MHGYVITSPVFLDTTRQYKFIPPASELKEASVEVIQLDCYGETDLVKKILKDKVGDDKLAEVFRLATDLELSSWEQFPTRLGRYSLGLGEKSTVINHEEDKEPLRHQLYELKARKKEKKHFRIAVVNGFGGNLGDNLIGATSLAILAKFLDKELDSWAIDILYGWQTNPACGDLVGHVPGVENIYYSGLSLAEFGRYDAYFDLSHLLMYPRYFEMPAIDFYIWWLGLDPKDFDSDSKRNSIYIPYKAWDDVALFLREAKGKRIFFSHRSSVPLRTFEAKQAKKFVKQLLRKVRDATVVLDFALDVDHERILNLDGKINSVDKLKALIAQVDVVITVDSFTLHVADACAKPTLLLCSSLPGSHYPYYPTIKAIEIPNARNMLGWMKTKISEDEWKTCWGDYEKAWGNLDVDSCLKLIGGIEAPTDESSQVPPRISIAEKVRRPSFTKIVGNGKGDSAVRFKHERVTKSFESGCTRISQIAQSLGRPGWTVVHVGAHDGRLTSTLADLVYPGGVVHAFEPRAMYFQMVCANAVLAGLPNVRAYQVVPANFEHSVLVNELDVFSESNPLKVGNSHKKTTLRGFNVKADEWPTCNLIVMHPPLPVKDIIEAWSEVIKDKRPTILLAPIEMEEGPNLKVLADLEYEIWAENLARDEFETEKIFFLALPAESKINVEGFKKVDFQ